MVKMIVCAVRKAGMSHQEFDRYWRNQHAAVIKSVPEFTRHVRRYVQCHLADKDTPFLAASGYDGVAELWFDDVAAVNAAFTEPRYLEVVRADELKFVDMERTVSLITEELEVI
ncbi:MAG: EthD domain-containing protein [Proteobacteria bacterium]|nr:EthD domain-containing protein [Pseudomonadota bacterium]